jgi:23S rRNA pseudouridine2605 synthase
MSRRGKSPHRDPAIRPADSADHSERLQKVLAAAGLGSRRQCEELIETGRVEVDRKVVTELGSKADPRVQEIRVDGVALPRPKLVHYVLNKPIGIVSTNADPAGRPRVIDLIPGGQRLFTVGRLDISSEGLILVTNDGDLANRLAHPRYGVEKTYYAEVAGMIEKEDLDKLRKGVYLAEGFAKVKHVKVKSQHKQSAILEIVLDEGRNREIRRLLARIGHKVLRLKRVALGPLRMGELEPGAHRPLTHDELRELRQATTPEGRRQRRKERVKHAAPRSGQSAGKSAAGKSAGPKARPGSTPGKPAGAKPALPKRPTIIGGDDIRPAGQPRRPKAASAARGGVGAGRQGAGASRHGGRPGRPGGNSSGSGAKDARQGAKGARPGRRK